MRLLRKYGLTIWILFIYSAFFGISTVVVQVNPPPLESELIGFHVKILRVQDTKPNLSVLLDNGERRDLLFPEPMNSYFVGDKRFFGLSAEQQRRLTGCDAQVYGAPIRYVWRPPFVIWKIDCTAQPVSYDQMVTQFRKDTASWTALPWVETAVMAFFSIGTFIQARKNK